MVRRKERPAITPAGAGLEAERRARLAAALRDNLRKRKAQKRGRDEAAVSPESNAVEDTPRQPLEGEPRVK
ncbi:MAG: hypothetical protein L0210_12240 [Rhodospirillales bacterium]|nr:hypothetical protein [Rhodospirillales bacterium]